MGRFYARADSKSRFLLLYSTCKLQPTISANTSILWESKEAVKIGVLNKILPFRLDKGWSKI